MNREEILEKSRRENRNRDVYEKEVLREGANVGTVVAAALATVFFIVQILVGGGINYGLYAVVFSIPAASFTVKALRLKRRHEMVVAGLYVLMTLLFSAAYLYGLVNASYPV